MILEDANKDTADAALETRFYPLQNWRADVVCVGRLSGGGFQLVEVVDYDTYGNAVSRPAISADYDRNGGVDGGDYASWFAAFEVGDASADVDLNGGIDGGDLGLWFDVFESGVGGSSPGACVNSGVIAGYAGYVRDRFAQYGELYHVRHRVYDTRMGTWTRRDSLGYVDGMGLYKYAEDSPVRYVDYSGEAAVVTKPSAEAIALALVVLAGTSVAIQQSKLCELGYPPLAIDWSLGLSAGTTVCKPIIKIAQENAAPAGAAANTLNGVWQTARETAKELCDEAVEAARRVIPRCPPCPPGEVRYDNGRLHLHWPCPGAHTHIKFNTGQAPWPSCKCSYQSSVWCHPNGPWVIY